MIGGLARRRGTGALLACMLLGGCWGGAQLDPNLEAHLRDTTRPSPETHTSVAALGTAGAGDDAGADSPPSSGDGSEPAGEAGASGSTAGAGAPAPTGSPQASGSAGAPSIPASDDSVRCGDGALDPEELCDVAIPEGEPGACPTSCDAGSECHPLVLELHTCWTRCIEGQPAPDAPCP